MQVMIANYSTGDLDISLLRAVRLADTDLVVMANHDPGITNYILPSNGGKVAGYVYVTVMTVRG